MQRPPPQRKQEFLRSIAPPAAGSLGFLLSQAAYIRKWVWGLSALICILGAADFILMCLLISLTVSSGKTFAQTGVYILCPYFLTAFFCLWVVRSVHSREAVYLCAGIAAGVSAGSILLHINHFGIFAGQNLSWWLAALAAFGLGTLHQS